MRNLRLIANEKPLSFYGKPSDIFSFGVFLLYLFSGVIPSTWQKKWDFVERERSKQSSPHHEEEMWKIIQKCLQKLPEDRPSAEEVKFHIQKCLDEYENENEEEIKLDDFFSEDEGEGDKDEVESAKLLAEFDELNLKSVSEAEMQVGVKAWKISF